MEVVGNIAPLGFDRGFLLYMISVLNVFLFSQILFNQPKPLLDLLIFFATFFG